MPAVKPGTPRFVTVVEAVICTLQATGNYWNAEFNMVVIHREFGCQLEIGSQIRRPPSNLASNVWEKGLPLSALPCLEVPRQKRPLKITEWPRRLPLSYVKQDFVFSCCLFLSNFFLVCPCITPEIFQLVREQWKYVQLDNNGCQKTKGKKNKKIASQCFKFTERQTLSMQRKHATVPYCSKYWRWVRVWHFLPE